MGFGDKESFPAGMRAAGSAFAVVPHPAGSAGVLSAGKGSGFRHHAHRSGPDFRSTAMVQHRPETGGDGGGVGESARGGAGIRGDAGTKGGVPLFLHNNMHKFTLDVAPRWEDYPRPGPGTRPARL